MLENSPETTSLGFLSTGTMASPRCTVCGSVMLIEPPRIIEGFEIVRARCIKNCRGSDIVQERRPKYFIPIREFGKENWKALAKKDQYAHNTEFLERKFKCRTCGIVVTGKFHPRTKTCSKECSAELNRITAHNRWIRIREARIRTKEKRKKWSRKII